jgi:exopolyphosphatase / guanosine-5'-triphosphate,3'-diphosphate pyrophosphatase
LADAIKEVLQRIAQPAIIWISEVNQQGLKTMVEIQPRYEFRVWAENLGEFKERLERLSAPVKGVTRENYFVSGTTDRCNAKIRVDLMEIKELIAEYHGLEQWKPVLKASFPLDRSVVASQVFRCLELDPPQLSRPQYAMAEFLDAIRPLSGIEIVEVSKRRCRFSLEACRAEFAAVTIKDIAQDTVALESANPDAVLRLIDEFGLGSLPNLSYVRQIKRVIGARQA